MNLFESIKIANVYVKGFAWDVKHGWWCFNWSLLLWQMLVDYQADKMRDVEGTRANFWESLSR